MAAVKPVTLNLDALTWDELDELEELTGFNFEEHSSGAVPRKVLKVVAWLLLRRENPALTLDEVGHMQVKDSITIEAPPKGNGRKPTPASRSRSASR